MTKKELLVFIDRIIKNCQQDKSEYVLEQLEEILEKQNSDSEILDIIDKAKDSVAELQEFNKNYELTKEDIEISYRRAIKRKSWEEIHSNQGRC